MSARTRRNFTKEEEDRITLLLEQGHSLHAVSRMLDRTEDTIRSHFKRLNESAAERRVRLNKAKAYEKRVRDLGPKDLERRPPANVIKDREQRLAVSPRDLTAAVCGDPLPGRSALDLRGRE